MNYIILILIFIAVMAIIFLGIFRANPPLRRFRKLPIITCAGTITDKFISDIPSGELLIPDVAQIVFHPDYGEKITVTIDDEEYEFEAFNIGDTGTLSYRIVKDVNCFVSFDKEI